MKIGDTVKYKDIRNPEDVDARFTVMEIYNDWQGVPTVKMKFICADLPIPPTEHIDMADIVVVKGSCEACGDEETLVEGHCEYCRETSVKELQK